MLCVQEGEAMLSADGKVRPRLRELTDSWDALILNCQEKKNRLHEAYQVRPAALSLPVVAFSCSSRSEAANLTQTKPPWWSEGARPL